MTTKPIDHRAESRSHRRAGKISHSCRKFRYPDHRAAVLALHSAVAARSLSPSSCRRERRIYDCGHCAGWHLTSKAARS